MLSERDMVIDALTAVKHEIVDPTIAALECNNPNVRQAFIQFRNEAEQLQMQLAQIAAQKGWYVPSPPANDTEIQQVKQQLTVSVQASGTVTRTMV